MRYLLMLLLLSGCAGTLQTKVVEVHNRAERIGTIGGKIVKRAGPLITAGVCIITPEYCILAKSAYKAAVITVNTIGELKTAEDGEKIIVLAQEFTKNVDNINEILVASGKEPLDLKEFQEEVKLLEGDIK